MAQKAKKKKPMKTTRSQSKAKSTKTSGVVVNGKRSLTAKKKGFSFRNLSSQRIFALITVLIFGGVGVYLLARSLAATPAAVPTVSAESFNVTTWNSEFSNKKNIGTEITKLGTNSDIIGVQEAHKPSQRKNIKSKLLCSSCKYAGYVKDYSYNGSSAASVPILWNKSKFSLVKKGYAKLSSKKTGINDTTKHHEVSAKYVTWVRLKDKATLNELYVLNLHTVASVEDNGAPNKNKTRLKLYNQEMDVLVSKLKEFKKTGLPIIVMGDFNVDYRTDSVVKNSAFPFARLGALDFHSSYERLGFNDIDAGTHGSKQGGIIIDYVFTLTHNKMTVNNEYIDSDTYGSDHHPVSVTLTLGTRVNTTAIPIGTPNPSTTEGVPDSADVAAADAYLQGN
jgi:endonuclease/exonuclease/phosphatase family metal-dependent hydrolase